MHSLAYLTFLDSLNGHLDPHAWTYDAPSFRVLEGPELQEATQALIARVAAHEPRAMLSAAAFGLTEAIPVLEQARQDARPFVRSCAHMALSRLRDDEQDLDLLAGDLSSPDAMVRVNAAFSLARLKRPDAAIALLGVLADSDSIVRSHAIDGIVDALELRSLMGERQAPLRVRFVRIYCYLKTVYQPEAEALRALFQSLMQGGDPVAMGLQYDGGGDPALISRFVKRLGKPEYDLEAIQAMSGHDREWAETISLVALERKDPGAPDAVVALGLPQAEAALREALDRPDLTPAFEQAARRALARL